MIKSKFRIDLGQIIQDSKLDTIKKIERKKLDYEIIKDNMQHQPTQDVLEAMADTYLKNKVPERTFKYERYKRMQEIHAAIAEKKRISQIRQLYRLRSRAKT